MMRNKFFGLFWKVQEQRLSEETLSWNAVRDPPPQISSDTISGVDVKLSREHELTLRLVPTLGKQSYRIEAQFPDQKLHFTKTLENEKEQ